MPLALDTPAPAFTLPDHADTVCTLADLRGQKLVLYVYPKDDTSGCTLEAQNFNALLGAFAEANTRVIGISPDSPKSHTKFRDKYGLAFPLLADETHAMLEAYGVWVQKSMYGRSYMGVERSTFLIDAQGILRQIWSKVKVPGHAEAVLAAARAL